jgi:hypothetical protein
METSESYSQRTFFAKACKAATDEIDKIDNGSKVLEIYPFKTNKKTGIPKVVSIVSEKKRLNIIERLGRYFCPLLGYDIHLCVDTVTHEVKPCDNRYSLLAKKIEDSLSA